MYIGKCYSCSEEVAEGNLRSPWRRGDVVLEVLPSMKGKMARGKRTCKRLHVTRPRSQSSWARPGDQVAGRLAEVLKREALGCGWSSDKAEDA